MAAHGDDQVGACQQLAGDWLGGDVGQADAAFGQRGDRGRVQGVGRVGAGRVGSHTGGLVGVEQGGGDDAASGVVGAHKQHPPRRLGIRHAPTLWVAA
jgi:hypothetical protein